jgi:Ca2+-binding RTX toxin-like protein
MPAQPSDRAISMIERLEIRRLLAVSLDDGTLIITGTKKQDTIELTVDIGAPGRVSVRVNGFLRRFTLGEINEINIQAGQGDDVIKIDNGKVELTTPTRMYGSGGDDTILGGRGKDRIYGGAGADFIQGGNNRDVLYGEAESDSLNGQLGFDYLDGGDDNDTLTGGDGVDRHIGGRGDDRFNIADGETDSANGGPGVDFANADDILDNLTSVENS